MAVNRELLAIQDRRRQLEQARKRQAVLAAIAAQQARGGERGGGGGGRGVSIGPIAADRARRSQAQAEEPSSNPFADAWKRDREALGGGTPEDDSGIFGNSIVKGIMTPVTETLGLLDAPRRVVMSGINELADAVNGGDASWSDFTEQVTDKDFGFGDVVGDTGNIWLDRLIGFAGDVALDPMTYVTLGSSKFIGSAGRAALAGEIAETGLAKGMAPDAIEELVGRAGRVGDSALSAAEREQFGLPQAGLRFGTRNHNVRIPGTEGIARAGGQTIANIRRPFTDTGIGQAARRLGGSRGPALREFTERLATGKGSMSAVDAASTVAASSAQKAAAQMLTGRFDRTVNRAARTMQGRGDLTRALEKGVTNDDTTLLSKITKRILEAQQKVGVAISPRKNYAPHYLTEDFQQFLDLVPDSGLVQRARQGKDIGAATGRLDARVFKPDSEVTVAGKKIKFDAADINDIEAKFHAAFPELAGKKLIEDDPGVWLPRLLIDASNDIGERTFERRLMAGGSLRAADDPNVTQTVEDVAGTKAANKKFVSEQRAAVEPLLADRAVAGEAVQRKLGQAVDLTTDVTAAAKDRAEELNAEATQRLGQAGRVADFAKTEMDRIATEGEAGLTKLRERILVLEEEELRLQRRITEARRDMNRSRVAGYRKRLEKVQAEHTALRRQYLEGQFAAIERDSVRKKAGRAVERQTELAARVGEGPQGAERLAEGQTLPQVAEQRYYTQAAETAERQGQALSDVEAARAARASSEEQARLAAELGGRPVQTPEELAREVQRLGGAKVENREGRVEQAITEGLTKKHSKALTPNDRRAARRALRTEELAEPDILSDAVITLNRPEIVQQWYDTQQALAEALRPYRQSNLADDAGESIQAGITPEFNERRRALIEQIEQHERGIMEARRRGRAGIEDPEKMKRFERSFTIKRNELRKELDELATTQTPRRIEAMADMNIVELEDRAARLADFMTRYANGVQKGGVTEGAAVRATREALESERKELMQRLAYRLPAERGAETETVARFADDAALDAEVQRRWDIEQANRSRSDEETLGGAITSERRARDEYASEQAKPKRAQEALDNARAEARKTRNAIDRARRRGEDTTKLRAELRKWKESIPDREMELRNATSQWKKYEREVGPPKAAKLPKAAKRENEQAFKARVRKELAGATEERTARGATRDVAAAFELERNLRTLVEPVREASRNLKRFQRLVESGRVSRGEMGETLEAFDVNELLTGGREAGQEFGSKSQRLAHVRGIESQLKVRVLEEQKAFADNVSKLLGRRVDYSEAVRAIKGGADVQRRMEDALGSMTPGARAKFQQHLRMQSVTDNRRLRDVNERLARMGEESGQREVTDMWQEVLTASPRQLIEGGTMKPRDLSQLTDADALADVSAQRELIGQARGQMDQAVKEAQARVIPGKPMDVAVGARRNFEQELADIASGNQAERVANTRRVSELDSANKELRSRELAGRHARDQLTALGSEDQSMARALEEELAPQRAGIEQREQQVSDVREVRSVMQESYSQLDRKTQETLSATTSMYDAARAGQIEAAVDVAATEDMVAQATKQLKAAKSYKAPRLSTKTRGKGQVPVTPAAAYEQAVNQVRDAISAGAPAEVVKLLDDAAQIAAGMVKTDTSLDAVNKVIQAAKKNDFIKLTKQVIAPGFVQYSSKTAGETFVMRQELKAALDNMENILWKEPGALGRAIDGYTRFFKAYATATPGFHLRNAISATFMNASDGVSIRNMRGGTSIWHAWEKYGADEPDTWMRHIVNPKHRAVAEDVVEAVYGSGAGGRFEAGEIGRRAFGGRQGKLNRLVNENKWLKGSQRAGSYTEGSVRAGMALDTLLGSGAREGTTGSVEQAVARLNRIHFNYGDVGEMDVALRRVVPFWTFLSRNVPLQLQQMVLNPRSYLHYQSFVRNMSEGMEQDDLPEYMRAAMGFRTTPGLALMPQVGLTNLSDSLEQLTTPSRMLAASNPLIKAPVQVMTNYNSYYDAPYGENDMERLRGPMSALAPLLGLLGQTEDIPGGGTATSRATADAVRDVIPPLAVINRLFGLSPQTEDKQGQGLINWLGLPVKQLSPQVLANEQKRRRGAKQGDAAQQQALQRVLAEL